MSVIGKPFPIRDAREKATGVAEYTVDIKRAGMLHGKVWRSPIHHGRILHIDTSRAEALPGVKAVITSRDIKPIKYGFGWRHRVDKFALAIDRVRFKGDEVAAVAAVDEDTAEEALELIQVEFEELPAVFDAEASMEADAPQLHDDAPFNLAKELSISKGDVDRAFAEAYHVYEQRFQTQRVHQSYLEPYGCVVDWDQFGKVTAWIGSMNSSGIRSLLAHVLDLSISRVRVIQPWVGGSFGSKVTLNSIYPIAAYLSQKASRPVKIIYTREEEFFASRPRVSCTIYVKTAMTRDGLLLGREVRLINDAGAYSEMAPAMLEVMSHRSDSVYRIPNIRTDAKLIYTNKSPIGAYRGYGNPQMTFALESQLDLIAEDLGIDPAELRLKNATREGDVTVHGWEIKSGGLPEAIQTVRERSGWDQKRGRRRDVSRGVGMGCTIHEGDDRHFVGFAGSNASIEIMEDGRVVIISGEGEYGQGFQTIASQIAAEVLGVPVESVDVMFPDTDRSAYALGPWGSRLTISGGNAVRLAAEDARRQLLEVAAELLEARAEDLEVADAIISVKGSNKQTVSVAEAAAAALYRRDGRLIMGRGTEEPFTSPMDPTIQTNPCSAYSFAAQVAEVEVDRKTGQIKLLGLYTSNDGGTILNPLAAEGQIEGCVLQGVGFACTENMMFLDGAQPLPSLLQTGVPNALDVPPIEVHFTNTYDPYGPFGAKGLSELGAPPVAAAVANAIYDAVGIRFTDLPLAPEKLLKMLRPKTTVSKEGQ
ncbi:MAG: xanthine dehydrogenase family protein molybdopterin-binding subunit [Chloroflexi bacterium]|nr:xanthine dehydrogenase family protein molybdopterin-binding subunit [Chloroflexota bacterium]